MKFIALEEHILPSDVASMLWTDDYPSSVCGSPALLASLADVTSQRLPAMDAGGVDIQVLSSVAPAFQAVAPDQTVQLSRRLNDEIATVVAAHPTRFRAFAGLPTRDPAAAAREARRAVTELGMIGVMVHGLTEGHFLDHADFAPMLSAIEELGVPLYLHPSFPPKQVADIYYGGLEPDAAGALSTAAWGWHAENGLHVLRMVVGGVFERHPRLQVIIGHMGENLPFSLMRANAMCAPLRAGKRSVVDVVREHIHITICGYATLPPFQCALSVFGADRILFSVDYPWGSPAAHTAFLTNAPISEEEREKIAYRNAERLLRL